MRTIGIVSIVLAIICVVSFAIAIALGPVLIFQGFESADVNQFEKISANGIGELKINLLDAKLKIYPIKGNEFEFTLTGTYAKNEYENSIELSVEKVGDVLEATIIYPEKLILINRNLNLAVGIPEEYYGKLKVGIASGDVYVKNLSTREFEIISTSGEVEIENIENSGDALIKTASGGIDIKEFDSQSLRVGSISGEIDCDNILSVKNFNLETTSGNIIVKNLLTEYSEFKSISGEIEIENSKNINSLKTTSGNIEIEGYEINENLNLETISGNIDLDLTEDSSVDVSFKSVSGNLDNSFGDIYKGKNKVNVKTTSGNFKIY